MASSFCGCGCTRDASIVHLYPQIGAVRSDLLPGYVYARQPANFHQPRCFLDYANVTSIINSLCASMPAVGNFPSRMGWLARVVPRSAPPTPDATPPKAKLLACFCICEAPLPPLTHAATHMTSSVSSTACPNLQYFYGDVGQPCMLWAASVVGAGARREPASSTSNPNSTRP